MTMTLETRVAGPVLYCDIRGELNLAMGKELFQKMLAEHFARGTRSILIDCRTVRGTLGSTQRYDLGVEMFKGHLQMIESGVVPPRIVVVAVPPLFDPRMLMESVAVNRGARFRAVQTIEEAAEWLEVEPASLLAE